MTRAWQQNLYELHTFKMTRGKKKKEWAGFGVYSRGLSKRTKRRMDNRLLSRNNTNSCHCLLSFSFFSLVSVTLPSHVECRHGSFVCNSRRVSGSLSRLSHWLDVGSTSRIALQSIKIYPSYIPHGFPLPGRHYLPGFPPPKNNLHRTFQNKSLV
jgi:hypothetical protein